MKKQPDRAVFFFTLFIFFYIGSVFELTLNFFIYFFSHVHFNLSYIFVIMLL